MKKLLKLILNGAVLYEAVRIITDTTIHEIWIHSIEKGMTYEADFAS